MKDLMERVVNHLQGSVSFVNNMKNEEMEEENARFWGRKQGE